MPADLADLARLQSLGTPWLVPALLGAFRLLLTVLATVVSLVNTGTVRFLAGVATETETAAPARLAGQILHAGVGSLVLLVATRGGGRAARPDPVRMA